MEDVSAYLAGKGVSVRRGPGLEVVIHCLFCPDGDPKGRGKMYVNGETWLWDCKRCGERGNRKLLLRHFGDQDEVAYVPGFDPGKRRKVLSEAADVAAEMLEANPKVLASLKARGLTMRTVVDYRIGYVPASWSLAHTLRTTNANPDLIASGLLTQQGQDFFSDRITIPYLSHGDVVQLRGKDPRTGGKYLTPTGDPVRLFNADALADATDVVITEGEFDCLVLQQALELADDPKLRAIAVVGIPGADGLCQGFTSYFESARRVYVALDPDETGKKAALRIKEALGSKARIVRLPEDMPKCDWTEFFASRGKDWRDVATLLSAADAEGRRLWTIGDSERQWRHVEEDIGGVRLGIPQLDAWLGTGLKPGQVMIPLAKTGVGKTNFLCNVAWYCRERPLLYVTLEMTRAEIYERLRRIAHFWNPTATDADIREYYSLLRIVDLNRVAEGELTKLAEEFAEEVGRPPELAFVDYLGYYAKGMKGKDQYEKTGNAAMSIKADAKSMFLPLITPHQVNRSADEGKPISLDDARDSGAVEETGDVVIGLWAPGDSMQTVGGQQVNSSVRYSALKNRNGQKNQTAGLVFSYASLVLVPPGSPAARLAEAENAMLWKGDSYADVLRNRRANELGTRQLSLVV